MVMMEMLEIIMKQHPKNSEHMVREETQLQKSQQVNFNALVIATDKEAQVQDLRMMKELEEATYQIPL